jgi:predicted transcriptional regulator of viral defense system
MIHNGTTTSVAAAESAQPNAAAARLRVLVAIKAAGIHGLTRDEACAVTGVSPNSLRPRVAELLAAGTIEEAGEIRRTASGRAAKVLTVPS